MFTKGDFAEFGSNNILNLYKSCSEIKKLYSVKIYISDISQIVQLLIGFK